MDVTSTAQQQRLRRNIDALRSTGSSLADRLAALPVELALPLTETAGGALSAVVCSEDQREILLASRRDPVSEAKRWVDGQDGLDEECHAVVITGSGLGYHVAEMLRTRRGGLVVVLEPKLANVHAAMRCQDFSGDLLLRRLVFAAEVQRPELFAALSNHNIELMLGTKLTQHPATGRAFGAACGQMGRDFADYLHYVRSAVVTSVQISSITCDNVLKNLPGYIGGPGIGPLKDAYRGRAAVCVAAGPSLRKNMHLLKAVKGKAPIIAVQTVLRTLLEAGIRPDFVTSLDYSLQSRRFYEDLGDLHDVTLIADPKVNPIVPDGYPGPVRMFYNDFAERMLAEMPAEHPSLPAGATVAHLNMYFARFLGCDPIVLIGQDLGFGENVYYAPGVPIQQTWSAELNRFNSMEMMEWQRIVRLSDLLRTVPGQDGREIYSDAQMFAYLQQFERDIATIEVDVVNATEGGARIAGAREMPLADVIARYIDRCDTMTVEQPRLHADAGARAETAIECLGKRLTGLGRMAEICRRVLGYLREMPDALNDRTRFNRLHGEMDPWRRKIDSITDVYRMVSDVIQLAELKRVQLDQSRARKDMDVIAERREQLTRDIQYVSLLTEGVEMLDASIRAAIGRLEGMR